MSGLVNKIKDAVHSDKSHSHTHGAPEGSHGPHSSRVANTADPRVDSDRDGSHNMGMAGGTATTGRTAGHGEFGSGTGIGMGTHGTAEGTHGPHSSRLANTADPRVDSDRDGSRTVGTGTGMGLGSTGTTGMGSGPHSSKVANVADPRVGAGVGSGGNTAGPHNSDTLNKMDPRVDSELDGSKTLGGNKTFQ